MRTVANSVASFSHIATINYTVTTKRELDNDKIYDRLNGACKTSEQLAYICNSANSFGSEALV